MSDVEHPKLFISYSWGSSEHQKWVVQLATELRQSGIDVILDKWDLREGHDAHAFMEQMVSNADIKKVAIICDKTYSNKADARKGGVGTETQIITPEIYLSQSQNKFVAVIRENDDEGKPFVPTYYKSRIYIDFTSEENYSDNFEQLVRWIFDQPVHQKPALGQRPAFLSGNPAPLSTTSRQKRVIDAIRNEKSFALPALDEYLNLLFAEISKADVSEHSHNNEYDQKVVEKIDAFIPYRNEYIEVVSAIALYNSSLEMISRIKRFFESLIPLMHFRNNQGSYRDWDFDSYRFIAYELLLYTLAILIKHERFERVAAFTTEEFYSEYHSERENMPMVRHNVFNASLKSLDHRNQRMKMRRLSIVGDIIKERCIGVSVDFRYIMQADFILFMSIQASKSDHWYWFPHTLIYLGHIGRRFETFSRCKSKAYFDKVKVMLGVKDRAELIELTNFLESPDQKRYRIPHWEFNSFVPSTVLELPTLASVS